MGRLLDLSPKSFRNLLQLFEIMDNSNVRFLFSRLFSDGKRKAKLVVAVVNKKNGSFIKYERCA